MSAALDKQLGYMVSLITTTRKYESALVIMSLPDILYPRYRRSEMEDGQNNKIEHRSVSLRWLGSNQGSSRNSPSRFMLLKPG